MKKLLTVFAAVLMGSSTAWADLCTACQGMGFTADIGTCVDCGRDTSSGAFKLCKGCSAKRNQCEHCRKKLDLVLKKDSDGKTVEASVGRAIRVELSGNPTTGYSWIVSKIEGESLKQVGQVEYASSADRLGAGGVFAAAFKPVKPGRTTISMEYRRPWEKNVKPAETFKVTVEVKEHETALRLKKHLDSFRIRVVGLERGRSLTLSVPEAESGQGETQIRISKDQAAKIVDFLSDKAQWDDTAAGNPGLHVSNRDVDVRLAATVDRLKEMRAALDGDALKVYDAFMNAPR